MQIVLETIPVHVGVTLSSPVELEDNGRNLVPSRFNTLGTVV